MPHGFRLQSDLPLIAAPMAGGPSTADLVVGADRAGAIGFVAGGNLSPDALAHQISAVRHRTETFGVNLFVPGTRDIDAAAFATYATELTGDAEPYGIRLDPSPQWDDGHWREKVDLLLENPVPLVSFTFALPDAEIIESLRRAGSVVLVTVTTTDEAEAAQHAGTDVLVVQGSSAGGHSGTWSPERDVREMATADLVRQIAAIADRPLIAAGGVGDSADVVALLRAGAAAVQVGSVLLRSHEAGTNATHRDALVDPRYTETQLTRAFTGRPARSLRNAFVVAHDAQAPTGYPAVHRLTQPLRREAVAAGDADRVNLWAGTGFRYASNESAETILHDLSSAL